MLLDEDFDADEILRDVDEKYSDDDYKDEDMRELNFGNIHDENANFNDMAEKVKQSQQQQCKTTIHLFMNLDPTRLKLSPKIF